MELNTKLIYFFKNVLKKINKKFIYFKVYFGNGIFFLFLGFLIGNLFGSLLNIFQESIVWQGLITMLIVLFVELINYLMYCKNIPTINLSNISILKLKYKISKTFYSWTNMQRFLKNFQLRFFFEKLLVFQKSIKKKFFFLLEKVSKLLKKPTGFLKLKNFFFSNFLYVFKKIIIAIINFFYFIIKYKNIFIFPKKKTFIKSFNLFKIGVLLGFFIDAFKVGS